MSYRKLNLDRDKIDSCRSTVSRIVAPVERYIERHSTTSIEQCVLQIMGAEGTYNDEPLAGLVVRKLSRDQMRLGAAWWFAKAFVHTGLDLKNLAQKIAGGGINFEAIPDIPAEKIKNAVREMAAVGVSKIDGAKKRRDAFRTVPDYDSRMHIPPADSLTPPGVPEIAAAAATDGPNTILSDPLSEIFARDINIKRALVDQHFSRLICARAGLTISTNGDNYFDLALVRKNAHLGFIDHFINEEFAIRAGLPPELMGFSHTFAPDLSFDGSFLDELARSQVMREIFPRSPLKYMPHPGLLTAGTLNADIINAMFCVCAAITEQSVVSFDPSISAAEKMEPIFKSMRRIGDEIAFTLNGKIDRRAHTILDNTHRSLKKIEAMGLMKAIGGGLIFETRRDENGGTGLDGVFQKDRKYFNPVLDILKGGPAEIFVTQSVPQDKPAETVCHKKRRRRGRRGGRRH